MTTTPTAAGARGRPLLGRRALLAGAGGRAALAAALTGCVPGLPGQGPPPRTFRVTPKYTFEPDLPEVRWSLAIAEPTAERTLDTNRVAVLTDGINVDYVALAFWVDRAPAMVQLLLVQSFRNSDRIAQVGTNRDRLRPNFLLASDLRAFQLNRGGGDPDTVRVRLDVQLLRMPERDPVGRESFAADRTPAASGIDGVVGAFDEALGHVMKNLVAWTLRTGRKAGA
jgi:cholesterol transport system auxiliary component